MDQRPNRQVAAKYGLITPVRREPNKKFSNTIALDSRALSRPDTSSGKENTRPLLGQAQGGTEHDYNKSIESLEIDLSRIDLTDEETSKPPIFLACLALGGFFGLVAVAYAYSMGMQMLSLIAVYSAVGCAISLASAVVINLLSSEELNND